MWKIWANYLLPKALKSCLMSNKLPNLVTLCRSRSLISKVTISNYQIKTKATAAAEEAAHQNDFITQSQRKSNKVVVAAVALLLLLLCTSLMVSFDKWLVIRKCFQRLNVVMNIGDVNANLYLSFISKKLFLSTIFVTRFSFFKKWAIPGLFFVYFWSFSNKQYNFYNKSM